MFRKDRSADRKSPTKKKGKMNIINYYSTSHYSTNKQQYHLRPARWNKNKKKKMTERKKKLRSISNNNKQNT
jgi:hypothetical protein